jgi:hypothetical protein
MSVFYPPPVKKISQHLRLGGLAAAIKAFEYYKQPRP